MLISDLAVSMSSTYHRSYISSDNLHWVENVVVGKHCFLVQWRIWFLGALKILSSWALPSKIPRGLPVSQNIWNIKTGIYIYCCWVCRAWNVLWYNFSIQNRISEKPLRKVSFAKIEEKYYCGSLNSGRPWICKYIYMCLVSVVSSPGWSFSVSQTFLQIPLGKVRTRIMERTALGYPGRLVSWLYFLKGVEFSLSS